MDSDDDKEHFDYKEIVKKESKKSKKRRKQQEKLKNAQEENFKLDLKDDRFVAVFENADFNIDPSHPNFKKTQSMSDMVEEKQRRIKKHSKQKNNRSNISTTETNESNDTQGQYGYQSTSVCGLKSDMNRLVNSVHRKSKGRTKEKGNDM